MYVLFFCFFLIQNINWIFHSIFVTVLLLPLFCLELLFQFHFFSFPYYLLWKVFLAILLPCFLHCLFVDYPPIIPCLITQIETSLELSTSSAFFCSFDRNHQFYCYNDHPPSLQLTHQSPSLSLSLRNFRFICLWSLWNISIYLT